MNARGQVQTNQKKIPRRTVGIRTHTQSFVLQKIRNTPVCTIEHSKNPQDERKKKPKKTKSEIMKGIIHKEKGNETKKQKNIDGKKP